MEDEKPKNEESKEEYLDKLKNNWHLGALVFVVGGIIIAYAFGDYVDLRFIIVPVWLILVFYLFKYYYVRWFKDED